MFHSKIGCENCIYYMSTLSDEVKVDIYVHKYDKSVILTVREKSERYEYCFDHEDNYSINNFQKGLGDRKHWVTAVKSFNRWMVDDARGEE